MSQRPFSFRDWRLCCAAAALLIFFRLALPLLGYRRIARLVPRRSSTPPEDFVARVVSAVRASARFVPGATCLTEACTGRTLFALRDYRVVMRVGVRRDGERRIAAHAWLLSGDRIILGGSVDEVSKYSPIADFG